MRGSNLRTAPRLSLLLGVLFAVSVSVAAEQPQASIERFLTYAFDKPGKKLKVHASASSGKYALATWTQGGKAGRVLLERRSDSWGIVVCAGGTLRDVAALKLAGLSEADAVTLSTGLARAEAKLPGSLRTRADAFIFADGDHAGQHPQQ